MDGGRERETKIAREKEGGGLEKTIELRQAESDGCPTQRIHGYQLVAGVVRCVNEPGRSRERAEVSDGAAAPFHVSKTRFRSDRVVLFSHRAAQSTASVTRDDHL